MRRSRHSCYLSYLASLPVSLPVRERVRTRTGYARVMRALRRQGVTCQIRNDDDLLAAYQQYAQRTGMHPSTLLRVEA